MTLSLALQLGELYLVRLSDDIRDNTAEKTIDVEHNQSQSRKMTKRSAIE
jgi:hypothetical protein